MTMEMALSSMPEPESLRSKQSGLRDSGRLAKVLKHASVTVQILRESVTDNYMHRCARGMQSECFCLFCLLRHAKVWEEALSSSSCLVAYFS